MWAISLIWTASVFWAPAEFQTLNGTVLTGNPYGEVVYIQVKPATTVCLGIINNSTSVFTASPCEIGDIRPLQEYVVVEIPVQLDTPGKTHGIQHVTRGRRSPMDMKVITVESPGFTFCSSTPNSSCSPTPVTLVSGYDDYTDSFTKYDSPGVVFGTGPPLTAGVVRQTNNRECTNTYLSLRQQGWPRSRPHGIFCVYQGSGEIEIRIGSNKHKILPKTTCPDSIGSLVKLESYSRTLGIILRTYCGNHTLAALALGSWDVEMYKPDPEWEPVTISTTPGTGPTEPSSTESTPSPGPGPGTTTSRKPTARSTVSARSTIMLITRSTGATKMLELSLFWNSFLFICLNGSP